MISNKQDFIQSVAEVAVRPLRFGFIVNREIDSTVFSQIIMYNTALWGGYFNIYVPTDGKEIRDDWWYILITHDPDIIFFVGDHDDDLKAKLYDRLLPMQMYIWQETALLEMTLGGSRINPILMGSVFGNLIREYPNIDKTASNLRYPVISAGDFATCLTVLFGQYHENSKYLEAIQEHLSAGKVICTPKSLVEYLGLITEFDSFVSPLDLTMTDLAVSYSGFSGLGAYSIVVTNEKWDDYFIFHYLRLIGNSRVIVIPYKFLNNDSEMRDLAQWFGVQVKGNAFTLLSNSITFDDLNNLRERLRKHLPTRETGWCIDLQTCNFQDIPPNVKNIETQKIVAIQNDILSFDNPSPNFVKYIPKHHRWIVDINFKHGLGTQKGFAPSMFRDLNFLLSNHTDKRFFHVLGAYIRIGRSLLALQSTKENPISSLRLPTSNKLVVTACENAGYDVQLGYNARYEGIMRLVGNIDQIKFLQNKDVLRLFLDKDFIQGTAYSLTKMLKKLQVKDGKLFIEAIRILANKQIILRGYNLECPVCMVNDWYDLTSIHETMTCQGCRSIFQMPLNADFAFRLNVLFAERNNQGAISTLLTLALLHSASRNGFHWQADIVLHREQEKLSINLDLVSMCDGALVVAECKNRFLPEKAKSDSNLYRQKITELKDQLIKCIKTAETLNADVFLFCTLEENIPDEIIQFIEGENTRKDKLTVKLVNHDELLKGKFAEGDPDSPEPVHIRKFTKRLPIHRSERCFERDLSCGEPMTIF